jgi:hypothetical protein
MYVGEYLKLYVEKWWSLMGGLAAFVLTLLALFVGDDEADKWLWPAAAFCWAIAGYFPWRAEHRERLDAEARAKKDAPDFDGTIDVIALAKYATGHAVIFLINVGNAGGGQSILQHWRMHIQPPDELEREIKKVAFDEDDELILTSSSDLGVVISPRDFIANKTYAAPLTSGVYRRGWLMAMMPEPPKPGTRFSASCIDAKRKRYVFDFDPAKGRGPFSVEQIGVWPDVSIKFGPVVTP